MDERYVPQTTFGDVAPTTTTRRPPRPRRLGRIVRHAGAFLLGAALMSLFCAWYTRREPTGPVPIFQGVEYLCERLPETPLSGGLMHLVRVDLTTPGLELYFSPLEGDAVAEGWQYRLKWAPWFAGRRNLSASVTATRTEAKSSKFFTPGDLARSVETIVSEGVINHVHDYSYLMWFDENLLPRIENKPPPAEALRRAKWAVGGQQVTISNGKVSQFAGPAVDKQVFIGFDRAKKVLFLAAFEKASRIAAGEILVAHGCMDGMNLDGGDSTGMFLGEEARNVRPGTLILPNRGIATFVGVRAPPLP
ncbi:MAG: phosphodiester glycosidase family protein [Tepidisphaeraceae bacterium]